MSFFKWLTKEQVDTELEPNLHRIGICPECNKRVTVRKTGVIGSHWIKPRIELCPGVGKEPLRIVAQYHDYS